MKEVDTSFLTAKKDEMSETWDDSSFGTTNLANLTNLAWVDDRPEALSYELR
jgi:hypothetical protein